MLDPYPGAGIIEKFTSYLTEKNPNLVETYKKDFGENPEFRFVLPQEIDEYAKSNDLDYYFTSAKTGKNVDKAFIDIGLKLMEAM